MPLLALYDALNKKSEEIEISFDFLFIGTRLGIEKKIIVENDIKFRNIFSGKLRRYFSFLNFFDLFKIVLGFLQSIFIILRFKPDIIISVGGFVSVPLCLVGFVLRKKIHIHQQDIRPGLANKLLAPFANSISVSFETSLQDYKNAIYLGNPTRKIGNLFSISEINEKLKINLEKEKKIILVIGGSTGATGINDLVYKNLEEIASLGQIIHINGIGKGKFVKDQKNYFAFSFLDQKILLSLMNISDLVISRAGISTISEIVYFQKLVLIIPMPKTHQEDNANYLAEKGVCIKFDQNGEGFIEVVKSTLEDQSLGQNIKKNILELRKEDADIRLADIVIKAIDRKK